MISDEVHVIVQIVAIKSHTPQLNRKNCSPVYKLTKLRLLTRTLTTKSDRARLRQNMHVGFLRNSRENPTDATINKLPNRPVRMPIRHKIE